MYTKQYIDRIIEEFTYLEEVKKMKGLNTPGAEYLFTLNTNAKNLYAE